MTKSPHQCLSSTVSTHFRINHCSRNTWIVNYQLANSPYRLRQHCIIPRRPYFRAVLTPLHRHERIRWINRLRGWTFRNWRRIWFSDEFRFLLQKRDGRLQVYRRRNERFSSSSKILIFANTCYNSKYVLASMIYFLIISANYYLFSWYS